MKGIEIIDQNFLFSPLWRDLWYDRVLLAKADEGTESRAWRVLIVEDEALVALDIELALQSAGFDVVGSVDSQDDAVAETFRLLPDIVLMDITLRQGDGIAASRAIGTAASVIFVSGNTDSKTLAAARQTNPAGFLTKPFSSHDLARAVRDACEQKGRA
jgi:DNA-binding NarL/FixJ family response regulator